MPDGPLPVGVQHIVAEHPGARRRRHADQCHQAPDHVDVVVDEVVRRHVVRTYFSFPRSSSAVLLLTYSQLVAAKLSIDVGDVCGSRAPAGS